MPRVSVVLNLNSATQLTTEIMIHDCQIELPKKVHAFFLKKINQFADEMTKKFQSADYYAKERNATNAKDNIAIGKYGELASYYILLHEGFPAVPLDFDVRTGSSKGWICDLPFQQKDDQFPNCHVKTCDAKSVSFLKKNKIDGYSWTFQYKNLNKGGGRDHLFKTLDSREVVIMMYVHEIHDPNVTLFATAPWNVLHTKLKDPVLPKLNGLKKCVYSIDF